MSLIENLYSNENYRSSIISVLKKTFKNSEIEKVIQEQKTDQEIMKTLISENSTSKIKQATKQEEEKFKHERATWRVNDIKRNFKFSDSIKKYLDIGSGDCSIPLVLGKSLYLKTCNIYCSDIYRNPDIANEVNFFLVVENEKFQVRNNSFDLVTLFQTLHHMKDMEFRLTEIYRILKTGGIMIIREHDSESKEMNDLITVEHMAYHMFFENMSYLDFQNMYYARLFSKQDLENKILSNGFSLLKSFIPKTKNNPTNYYYAVFRKN